MRDQPRQFDFPNINYQPIKYMIDFVLWTLAAPMAFWLRLEAVWLPRYLQEILIYTLIGMLLKSVLIRLFGLHRQSWHGVGVLDLYALIQAIAIGLVSLLAISFLINPYLHEGVPRSIPLLDALLALLMLGGVRLVVRFLHEYQRRREIVLSGHATRVLLVGAGNAGTMVARELLRHPEAGLIPVGFLDDEPFKQNERLVGLRVLGQIKDMPQVVKRNRVDQVLITMPSAPGKVVRSVVNQARQVGVSYRTIPGIYQLLSGKTLISQLRDVEMEDLLRREPVELDQEGIAEYIEDQVVLVTGAGGSIGSEIVRQMAPFSPGRIILLGRGENSLYELERELDLRWPGLVCHIVVANVQQRDKIKYVFSHYRPQVVFHTAAHKHVPLMELNPDEAVFNNVGGTQNLIEAALGCDVERFVNISTDKAVNPTSVMGASKRVAEYLVGRAASQAKPGQAFVSVRFGNVLGSRGSVVPIFRDQIRRGGPLTVTHPDIVRYFMTIPEAAQLVLEAGRKGENGAVYVLDMGEPIKIVDLARDLILLSGLEPSVDIDIFFTGLRPGEKLFEEPLTMEENEASAKSGKMYVVRRCSVPAGDRFNPLLEALFTAAHDRDGRRIREVLQKLVPAYKPRL